MIQSRKLARRYSKNLSFYILARLERMERICILMTAMSEKTVVGLTGPIASGKSSALSLFSELGWSVISSDILAHEILASNQIVQQKIIERWGSGVFKSSGSIDKAMIARIVFKKELEENGSKAYFIPSFVPNGFLLFNPVLHKSAWLNYPFYLKTVCKFISPAQFSFYSGSYDS